uniref:JHL06P13.8 protein n=1 Tax=Rhizophora mucronata TaxID=61149 RepID=A0A2P2JMU0_RHIMU
MQFIGLQIIYNIVQQGSLSTTSTKSWRSTINEFTH